MASDASCARSSECAEHALPVDWSRKDGGQRSSAEAPPTIQTRDCRRINHPPDPRAGSMESEKSGGGRGRGEKQSLRLFVA